MDSVTIGGKNLYDEYGFYLASKSISMPEAYTHLVEVPLRDGAIDCSEALSDVIKYKNRNIEIKLLYMGDREDFPTKYSELCNFLHGQKLQIIFSDDLSFYYFGRITVSKESHKKYGFIVTLKCDCDPWKYDVHSALVDWDWDTFDLEDGVINEAGEIVVNGTVEFDLVCRKKREFPSFIVMTDTGSDVITLTFGEKTYQLYDGSQTLYDLFLIEGYNHLAFSGNGTVAINYIGGEL